MDSFKVKGLVNIKFYLLIVTLDSLYDIVYFNLQILTII